MTTCRRGHPLTPDNVLTRSDGGRQCRTCHRDRVREYCQRRAAARKETPVVAAATPRLDRAMLDTLYQTGDLPLLGHVAFWKVEGLEIPTADLAAALTAHGFASFAPRVPTHRHALRAAIEEWLEAQGATRTRKTGAKSAQRDRISVVNDDQSETMAFLVVTEDLDLARLGMSSDTRLRFILWKEGPHAGQFAATTDATGTAADSARESAVTQEVGKLYAKHKGLHDAGEIARLVKAIVESFRAVSLRPNGGVYFLPADQREGVDRLRRCCADLAQGGDGIFLALTPVLALAEMKRQYAALALTALQSEAERLETYLRDQFLAKPEGTVGATAVARQITQFRQFREKATAYADLLSIRATDLLAAITRLEAQARAIVLRAGPDDAPAPEDAAPEPDTIAAK